MQSPEFKPQYCQKEKQETNEREPEKDKILNVENLIDI
jgi:hypothetical protein